MNSFEEFCNDAEERKSEPIRWWVKILATSIALVLVIPFLVFESFVIMTVWNWYLAATTGITLTLVSALALNVVGGIIVYSPRKCSMYETMWKLWMVFKMNTIVLVIGAVLQLFV